MLGREEPEGKPLRVGAWTEPSCWKPGGAPCSRRLPPVTETPSAPAQDQCFRGGYGGLSNGNGSLTWAFQQLFSFRFTFPNTLSSIQKSTQPQDDRLVLPTWLLDIECFCICTFRSSATQEDGGFPHPSQQEGPSLPDFLLNHPVCLVSYVCAHPTPNTVLGDWICPPYLEHRRLMKEAMSRNHSPDHPSPPRWELGDQAFAGGWLVGFFRYFTPLPSLPLPQLLTLSKASLRGPPIPWEASSEESSVHLIEAPRDHSPSLGGNPKVAAPHPLLGSISRAGPGGQGPAAPP